MRTLAITLLISATGLLAQSAETLFFVADMRGANEVPAVVNASSGSAVMFVHVMKDEQGKVTSGTVDFNVSAQFADAFQITGLHIHSGAAGVNGPVTINTGIASAENLQVAAGSTLIQRSGQVKPDNTAGLATLEGMLVNPAGYYVNIHTNVNPGGQFRGQLYRAERRTFMTTMSGANEVPAIEGAYSGLGSFHGFRAFDSNGRYVTGGGLFVVNYNLAPIVAGGTTTPQRMIGLHIHRGAAGVNGPVVLNSNLASANAFDTPANGVGTVSYLMAAPQESAAAVLALNDMWDAPDGFYMNMHSTTYPGGVIRGQVRSAENINMSVNMLPSNEVPAVDIAARAVSAVQLDLLRGADGAATHAMVLYSVNFRFPGEVTFTGLHIHEGAAGVNGPVRIDSAITGANNVPSADGFGNVTRIFNASTPAALAAINGLLVNPEGYYLNIHSTVSPGGVVRGQLAPVNAAKPRVLDFISGVSDPSIRAAARGGLMTAFGENLFKVPASLFGAVELPAVVNGTSAKVGDKEARVMAMGETGGTPPQYVVVQVPFDAAMGAGNLVLSNSNGAGAGFATNVAAAAPGIYFDSLGAIVLRPNLTLVRPDSPVTAGETVALVATGLGATTPALETGQFAPLAPSATTAATVTATIGGRDATVISSFALPGYAGVYAVAIVVPAGIPAGNAMAQIKVGTAASNNAAIPVR